MRYHQQKIYRDIRGKEQIIATFWIDDDGKIDMDNLPRIGEIATLLEALMVSDVHVVATGNVIEEENYNER